MNDLPRTRKARLFYVVFLVLILASGVPLTALTFYKLKVERDGFAERLQQDMDGVCQAVSRNVQIYADSRRREASLLAGMLTTINPEDVAGLQAALAAQAPRLRESFRVVQVVDRQLKVLAAYDTQKGPLEGQIGLSLAQRSDLELALGPTGFGITDVFVSAATEHPCVRISVPLGSSGSKPWGLLACTVDLRDIEWATSVPSDFPTQVQVIDSAGNQILSGGKVPGYIAPIADVLLWNYIQSAQRGWLPEQKAGSLRYSPGVHMRIPGIRWYVLVRS